MNPLTDTEKSYFDTIKQVTRSARPEHLSLRRMKLDDREVAVVGQTLLDKDTAAVAGWMPLALILDDGTSERLVSPDGSRGEWRKPEGLEGPA